MTTANASSSTMMVTISSFLPRTAAVRPVAARRSLVEVGEEALDGRLLRAVLAHRGPMIRPASWVDRPPMSLRSSSSTCRRCCGQLLLALLPDPSDLLVGAGARISSRIRWASARASSRIAEASLRASASAAW